MLNFQYIQNTYVVHFSNILFNIHMFAPLVFFSSK